MKKEIMTLKQIEELGIKNGINEVDMHTRLLQNATEIATQILPELEEILQIGRSSIVTDYIEPWSREFEQIWLEQKIDDEYYDFISEFADNKLKEVKIRHGLIEDDTIKTYKVTALYYSSREVVVKAHNEDEAIELAKAAGSDDSNEACLQIGKNAILEGVENAIEVQDDVDDDEIGQLD